MSVLRCIYSAKRRNDTVVPRVLCWKTPVKRIFLVLMDAGSQIHPSIDSLTAPHRLGVAIVPFANSIPPLHAHEPPSQAGAINWDKAWQHLPTDVAAPAVPHNVSLGTFANCGDSNDLAKVRGSGRRQPPVDNTPISKHFGGNVIVTCHCI